MVKRLKNKIRRLINKVKLFFKDPPLDVVGVGVIANLSGRTALYGAFGYSFAVIGQLHLSALFVIVMTFDIIIHAEVLRALRRLMAHDVHTELSKHQFTFMQTIG